MGIGIGMFERIVGGTTASNVLYVTSDFRDRIHNGDVQLVLEELAILHKRVINTMPEMPDVFFKSDEYSDFAKSYRCAMFYIYLFCHVFIVLITASDIILLSSFYLHYARANNDCTAYFLLM